MPVKAKTKGRKFMQKMKLEAKLKAKVPMMEWYQTFMSIKVRLIRAMEALLE